MARASKVGHAVSFSIGAANQSVVQIMVKEEDCTGLYPTLWSEIMEIGVEVMMELSAGVGAKQWSRMD